MKWTLKDGILLQEIGDKKVLVALNIDTIDYSQVITLNETAACLAEKLNAGACSEDELVAHICELYEVDETSARKDIQELMQELDKKHIVDACD